MFFGYQKWTPKLAPKWDPKLISTLKAEKQLNASQLAFSWFSGVEVGSKNRPKIDPKMESKMECILVSIFNHFGRFLVPSWDGKWSKNQSKTASKKRLKKEGQQDGCLGRPRVRDVQRTNAARARARPRRGRGAGAARAPAGSLAPRLANIKRQLNKQTSS